MIVVAGAPRSGTSLWMQVLTAAGFPYIGSEFSYSWQVAIGQANPKGFYESLFRQGINHTTNPHPKTGRYLHPDEVRHHVVKVFVPGLIRSDVAFVDLVVATIRPWREFALSLQRLHQIEEEHAYESNPQDPHGAVQRLRDRRSPVPPALQWWLDNHRLLHDLRLRRHRYHLVAYDELIADPAAPIGRVLDTLGRGDLHAAVAAVDPRLRTLNAPYFESSFLSHDDVRVFDELYARILHRSELPHAFLEQMNDTHERLLRRWAARSPAGPDER